MIDKFIGIPYNHFNKNGLNCWGLVAAVYSELGKSLVDFKLTNGTPRDIANTFNKALLSGEHNFKQIFDKPKQFDLLLFKRTHIYHVGLFFDGKCLHSSTDSNGVVIQSIDQVKRNFKEVTTWRL